MDRHRHDTRRLGLAALALVICSSQAVAERWYRVELLAFSQRGSEQLEQWPATPALAYPEKWRFLESAKNAESAPAPTADAADANLVLKEGEELRGSLSAFQALPQARRELAAAAESMRRSSRYRVLFHETWAQPVPGKRSAIPLILDRPGSAGQWPELQGSVTIYLSRYLHLETNLWLNTQGDYLSGDWRMPAPPRGPRSAEETGDEVETSAETEDTIPPSQFGGDSYYWQAEDSVDTGPVYPYRHAVALQQKRRMRSKEVHYIDHPMLGLLIKFTPLIASEPTEVSSAQ